MTKTLSAITEAVILYSLGLAIPVLLAQAQVFQPPEPKVSQKFITPTPAYLLICDNGARRIVTKEVYQATKIGDVCPPKNPHLQH